MATTAKNIADKLGLSQPTVSRILSGAQGHRVSPETKQRVLEAALQMDYRPNAVARSLRRQRTNIVGFYSGYASLDARHDFIGAIVGGLQAACENYDLDLLLHGTHTHRSPEEVYNELVDGRVDGLFFHGALENPLIARLAASPMPVIALVDAMEGMPSVVGDNAQGMSQLVGHLWDKGHRSIAYLMPSVQFASVRERVAAFQQALWERGVPNAPLLTIPIEETEGIVTQISRLTPRPTAVCCWNDRAAYNLLWHCLHAGVRIPNDLAIAGFDGFVETKLPFRRLTTVSVPYGQITEDAMRLMISRVRGQEIPDVTTLPASLLIGDTT